MGPVLVFGHRNPDNDSISSAVAYAHLKNVTDPVNAYVPARLGPVPAETRHVFERFGAELPDEIGHVHTRVRDVMTDRPVTIRATETMLAAGRLMRERNVRGLPVVGANGELVGLLSARLLAERYIEETEVAGFDRVPVSLSGVANALDGVVLTGDAAAELSGDVIIAASEPATLERRIKPGDLIVVGDRHRSQPMALEAGAACLVITGGAAPGAGVLELAREKGAAVVSTRLRTYAAARRLALAHSVADVMDTEVLTFSPETLLSEASEDTLASKHREAVVTESDGTVTGILTRTDIARGTRRRVVLVDHNEASQSAAGIEEADVIEIVDHHRVGDIQTAGPVLFLNLPVGSTATIVAERYEQLGVEMPDAIAGILLGALLTDTVILKSPTTTDTDRRVCERLAARLELDATEFGMEVFRSRGAGQAFSAEGVVTTDIKEYRAGDMVAAIAQYETVDLAGVMAHGEAIRAAMEAVRAARGYDVVVLMVTDIVREGSEIIAVGKTRVAERALGISLEAGSAWMDGVLSRKKQVAAAFVRAVGA